ncbi:uncharacterized protein LOC120271634 [Dioscorea cayenensis subsp. rotundata]|uniref:Uncharacterized protein LOC120271634 n=1 Tax=Dioscorea cayennensis subsp. rotundata TaxID=55577 RepID=A0AB40C3B6_DIOCR|nr:uncharacterized protein LOC120271634 [Dioscorea cayenensis subsp. rotundata]
MISTKTRFVHNEKKLDEFGTILRNLQASIKSLDNQVGQLARGQSERSSGSLPRNTKINPREQLKAVTLRSGRQLEARERGIPSASNDGVAVQEGPNLSDDASKENGRKTVEDSPNSNISKGHEYKPVKYAKFLKLLVTNKKKLEEQGTVALTRNYSAIPEKKMLQKIKDPGSFVIPCVIGEGMTEHALADDGASLNVMPYNLFLKLELEDLRPTRMTLQLPDRSVRRPRGVVEDVLVRVDKLIFPIDFVILDVDDNVEVPLIIGRQFLNISGALIDVKEGKMTLRVGDEQVVFTLPEELLALNPLDEYLNELVCQDAEEELSHPPTQQINQVEGNSSHNGKKIMGVKKMWRKSKEKQKENRKISTLPPDEVDHLFFGNRGKFKVFSCLSLNFPSGNTAPNARGNFPSFVPP